MLAYCAYIRNKQLTHALWATLPKDRSKRSSFFLVRARGLSLLFARVVVAALLAVALGLGLAWTRTWTWATADGADLGPDYCIGIHYSLHRPRVRVYPPQIIIEEAYGVGEVSGQGFAG